MAKGNYWTTNTTATTTTPTMAAIEVRGITPSDHDEWFRLFNLYLEFYHTQLPEEEKEATFQRCLDDSVDMWSAVALHPETKKPIGLANYLKHLNTWSTRDKLYLNDLYVDEQQRLKGVGRSLIEYVFARGEEMNVFDVYWNTAVDNYRAQLLYSKVAKNKNRAVYYKPL